MGTSNRILTDGTFDYAYDAEGNRIRRTEIATGIVTEYEWDHRNRLIRAIEKDAGGAVIRTVTITYDMFDQWIARVTDADGAGPAPAQIERYIQDRGQVALVFDGAGQFEARYLYGPRTDWVLAEETSGGVTWMLQDHLGTVRDVVDSSGTPLNHLRYETFGAIIGQSNAAFAPRFSYTGREFIPELDLYYYRGRFYDPGLRTFISEDSLGFSAGDSNLYRYVGNNPLTRTDPSGNFSLTEGAGLALGGVLGAVGGFIKSLVVDPVVFVAKAVGAVAFGAVASVTGPDSFAFAQAEEFYNESIGGLVSLFNHVDDFFHMCAKAQFRTLTQTIPDKIKGAVNTWIDGYAERYYKAEQSGSFADYVAAAASATKPIGEIVGALAIPESIGVAGRAGTAGKLERVVGYLTPERRLAHAEAAVAAVERAEQAAVKARRAFEEVATSMGKGAEGATSAARGAQARVLAEDAGSIAAKTDALALDLARKEARVAEAVDRAEQVVRKLDNERLVTILEKQAAKGDSLIGNIQSAVKTYGQEILPISGANAKAATVIKEFARSRGLEIGIRAADPITASVTKAFSQVFSAKPVYTDAKSFFGVLYNEAKGIFFRSDLDLAWVRQNGRFLNNQEALRLVDDLNRALIARGLKTEFKHGPHFWVVESEGASSTKLAKIGHPGAVVVYSTEGVKALRPWEVTQWALQNAEKLPQRIPIEWFKKPAKPALGNPADVFRSINEPIGPDTPWTQYHVAPEFRRDILEEVDNILFGTVEERSRQVQDYAAELKKIYGEPLEEYKELLDITGTPAEIEEIRMTLFRFTFELRGRGARVNNPAPGRLVADAQPALPPPPVPAQPNLSQTGVSEPGTYEQFLLMQAALKQGGGSLLSEEPPFTAATRSQATPLQDTIELLRLKDTALSLWRLATGSALPMTIRVAIADLPAGQLGEAVITRYDSHGLPVDGRITVDVNGDGHGWFVDTTPLDDSEFRTSSPDVAGRYDLFTVIAHEVGHLLGFDGDFAGLARHLEYLANGLTLFVAPGFTATLTSDGDHVDSRVYNFSLMAATLGTGVRKLPSALEALIISIARNPDSPSASQLGFADLVFLDRADFLSAGSNASTAGATTTIAAPLGGAGPDGIVNGGFAEEDQGNPGFGWTIRGQTGVSAGQAVLTEGGSVYAGLSQTFIVPADVIGLSFVIVGLQLGHTSGEPPDAFEVALLEAHTMAPVVGTAALLSNTDAALNIQSDGSMFLSPKVAISGSGPGGPMTVQFDLTGIAAGTELTLYFDLYGFGADDSSVVLDDVAFLSANVNPVAAADTAVTDEDTPVVIAILDNDSDADGSLNPATVAIVTQPAHGSLQIGASGSITYLPAANFYGVDTFQYTVEDDDGLLSNTATVSVTIQPVNDAPVFVSMPPGSLTLQEDPLADVGDGVLKTSGAAGTTVLATFNFVSRDARFVNEFGLYKVSDALGTVNGLLPGQPGYAQAALQNAITLFTTGDNAGAVIQVTLEGGTFYAFYMIQNNNLSKFLATNPGNSLSVGPRAFFSVVEANPDSFDHLQGTAQNGRLSLAWEDGTFGGDRDFNDAILEATFASPRFVQNVPTDVPAQTFVPNSMEDGVFETPATPTPLKAEFLWEFADAGYRNEFGLYRVTDATGRIGNLRPGDPGYAAAALQSATVLFASNQSAGTRTSIFLEPGAFYAFYMVQNGTTARALQGNSLINRKPNVFFSVASANMDGFDHMRGSVTNGSLRFEWEDQTGGGDRDFNDAVISARLVTPTRAVNELNYTAQATDVDGDPITYTLLQAPLGATLDSQTGMLRWPALSGDYPFAIQASDGHGGHATQNYSVRVN
ncbi:MAG TPA: DUF4114 domain-containing protein [Terriglobia bacterium]|nr:DUF4114 domain-containing protein [Terriglobia bacterium]